MNRMRKSRRPRKLSAKWSEDKCHLLIRLVESKPNLWDVKNNDYKNPKARDLTWNEISHEMRIPKEEASNKWNLLRQQFRNAFNKMKTGDRPTFKPPNAFYNAMLFLKSIINVETSARRSSNVSLQVQKISKESEASVFSAGLWSLRVASDSEASSSSSSVIPAALLSDSYRDPLANRKDEDEFDLWGKSVAATLRNYPDGMAVRKAKSKMNLVMAALEAGELDAQYVPCKQELPNST